MSLEGLCAEVGVTRYQIYRWVHQGLLPRPNGCRRYPVYTQEHVRRAKLIKDTLSGEYGPRTLADLRDRFELGVAFA